MPQTIKLSVVIPNYNEKANLDRGVLDEVRAYLRSRRYSWEVIISDDGSTDGSLEILTDYVKKHPGFRLLKNSHAGKAKAVFAGINAAHGKITLFTDMDQSTPLKEIEKLLPWYDRGFDVVFGSRGRRRNASPVRQFLALGFLTFRRLLLLSNVIDTQCGFKSFRTNVAREIFPLLEVINRPATASGWSVSAFDVELLFLAQKRGHHLKEIRVSWKDRDASTSKQKNFLNESWDMLKQVLRVKKNDLQGRYVQ